MKKLQAIRLFLFVCTAFLLASCLDNGSVSLKLNYYIGVHNARFVGNDSALVRGYLNEKKCPYAAVENISGETLVECDTLCIAKMRAYTQLLSAAELDSLPLSDSCSFKFAAARYEEIFGNSSRVVYLGAFDYKRPTK